MKTIILFLIATFSLTYVSHGLLAILTTSQIIEFDSIIGFTLFFIGGSSPTLFAVFFILKYASKSRKNHFKHELLSVHHKWYYWLLALGIPLLLGGIFQVIYISFTSHTFDSSVPAFMFFMIILTSIIFGGLEEVGWRGFLQSKLQSRINLLVTAVIIGIIWGLWHIPLFFIEEVSHFNFKFIPFLLGAVMLSTYLTWLYAKTKSLVLVILFHASVNASATIGLRLLFEHTLLTYLLITIFTLIGLALLYFQPPKVETI